MDIRRPTYMQMRRALTFYARNCADPKHATRAHQALMRLAREIDLDNKRHDPRPKRT